MRTKGNTYITYHVLVWSGTPCNDKSRVVFPQGEEFGLLRTWKKVCQRLSDQVTSLWWGLICPRQPIVLKFNPWTITQESRTMRMSDIMSPSGHPWVTTTPRSWVKTPGQVTKRDVVASKGCLKEVKRELKRICIDGCRYNEWINTETGGSKTSHIHFVEHEIV
jgi:hypothetical protein